MSLSQLEEIGVGLTVALSWEEGLHSALMPITPQASMGSLADSKGKTHNPKIHALRKICLKHLRVVSMVIA